MNILKITKADFDEGTVCNSVLKLLPAAESEAL
jgi:hypothetical protein